MDVVLPERGSGPLNANIIYVSIALALVSLIASMSLFAGLGGFGQNKFVVDERTVLLTGGSEGMGLEVAKLLSAKGANVVIVARTLSKLEKAIEVIAAAAKRPKVQRFHYISADVTSPDENIRLLREVTEWNDGSPPDIVWANAGSALPGLFLDTSIHTFKAQMDIDYFAALYLAHATFRLWLASSSSSSSSTSTAKPDANRFRNKDQPPLPRHFVITSSLIAFIGLAGYTPYAPAKSALRSLHDTLTSELNLYNSTSLDPSKPRSEQTPEVKVHTIFPGTILSEGLERENLVKHPVTKLLEEDDQKQTPAEVAKVTIAELEKGRSLVTTYLLGMIMRAAGLMTSVRDRWFVDTILSWVMAPALLFITPDLGGKVNKWAKKNGRPKH